MGKERKSVQNVSKILKKVANFQKWRFLYILLLGVLQTRRGNITTNVQQT